MEMFGPDGRPLPPEIAAAMQEQIDHAQMHADAQRHDLVRFMDELSTEQIVMFRTIVQHCADEESGLKYASHIGGYLTGVLHYRDKVCSGCGKNHDDISSLVPDEHPLVPILENMLEARTSQLAEYSMREYTAEDVADGLQLNPMTESPVFCLNCNMLYQSLEDRMLKRVCEGCVHKQKWG